jgi:hypothetical protein
MRPGLTGVGEWQRLMPGGGSLAVWATPVRRIKRGSENQDLVRIFTHLGRLRRSRPLRVCDF